MCLIKNSVVLKNRIYNTSRNEFRVRYLELLKIIYYL